MTLLLTSSTWLTPGHVQVSKAAAIHLTRQMALEFSTKGIDVRVNGLAIGTSPSLSFDPAPSLRLTRGRDAQATSRPR